MKKIFSTVDVSRQTLGRLAERWRDILPLAGVLFLLFGLANTMRGIFPGVYVFDPFDQGWLLLPEAMVFGPVLAFLHYRILAPGTDFAWSVENLLVKLGKAAAYYYVLILLFKLGSFFATQVVPSLIGFVFGTAAAVLFPLIVGIGFILFLLVYIRLVFVYSALTGTEREPLVASISLTKGKGRQIVSSLLLLAAPVLIPWIGATVYGGDMLDPTQGQDIPLVPILARSFLQSMGAIILSTGLCVMFEALVAADGDSDQDT